MNYIQNKEDHYEEMHKHLVEHLSKFLKDDDIQGLEISSLIRILANYYSAAITQKASNGELSGPRMGILLRLMVSEDSGTKQGINPTQLSHFQHVKKNTISSLLRGLEENNLVERHPDAEDKRGYVIRITPAGKELVKTIGPKRLQMMNELASGLTPDEKKQLIHLLDKLRKSIRDTAGLELRSSPKDPEDDQFAIE